LEAQALKECPVTSGERPGGVQGRGWEKKVCKREDRKGVNWKVKMSLERQTVGGKGGQRKRNNKFREKRQKPPTATKGEGAGGSRRKQLIVF